MDLQNKTRERSVLVVSFPDSEFALRDSLRPTVFFRYLLLNEKKFGSGIWEW